MSNNKNTPALAQASITAEHPVERELSVGKESERRAVFWLTNLIHTWDSLIPCKQWYREINLEMINSILFHSIDSINIPC